MQCRCEAGKRSHDGDTEAESSCSSGAACQSAATRGVAEGDQCGRLHPVPLIHNGRPFHSRSKSFHEGGTQADREDGPSTLGFLRRGVAASALSPNCMIDCRIANRLCLPCCPDRLVLCLKALQHFMRCALWGAAVE